jgi:hypothetical protein
VLTPRISIIYTREEDPKDNIYLFYNSYSQVTNLKNIRGRNSYWTHPSGHETNPEEKEYVVLEKSIQTITNGEDESV